MRVVGPHGYKRVRTRTDTHLNLRVITLTQTQQYGYLFVHRRYFLQIIIGLGSNFNLFIKYSKFRLLSFHLSTNLSIILYKIICYLSANLFSYLGSI